MLVILFKLVKSIRLNLQNAALGKIMTDYEAEFTIKKKSMENVFARYFNQSLDCFKSPPKHYRMRAEFRIWHEGDSSFHIMFDRETKAKFRVNQLDAAHPFINDAMRKVIKQINANQTLRTKLFQIDYLVTTTNQIVVSLIYHKTLDDFWIEQAESLRTNLNQFDQVGIIGRAKKQKRVIGQDYVIESLQIGGRSYTFKQVENSFTQPNAFINQKMVTWACENALGGDYDLLELYCGSGNFTIPLSQKYRKVLGTEISKSAVTAAQFNIEANKVDNLKIARLSSEEYVQAHKKVRQFNRLEGIDLDDYNFSTVLVDPPRAGLDDSTLSLVSKFDNVIYISCNPTTLKNNLETLCHTHKVIKAAFFDQFPFTPHIESGVILSKI